MHERVSERGFVGNKKYHPFFTVGVRVPNDASSEGLSLADLEVPLYLIT